MKKMMALLALLVLLAGCGGQTGAVPPAQSTPAPAQSIPPQSEAVASMRLRIVDGAENGRLVLAGESEVYELEVGETPVFLDGEAADASALEDGMTAEIYGGITQEIWPAQLKDVERICVYSRGTEKNPGGTLYDLCGLYLAVLEELWGEDDGLNGGIELLSVDLSQAPGGLTDGEKAAVAWIFAGRHGVQGLTLSFDELAGQGYLTEISGAGEAKLYEWENGVYFEIKGAEWGADEAYSLPVVKFEARKWRTPLGAYGFSGQCVWRELGTWEDYTTEGFWIS